MNAKLPVVSGKEAIRRFEKLGYKIVRKRGSHVRLVHPETKEHPLTIPDHKSIGKGLLRKLLRDAKIDVEAFTRLR